MERLQHLLSAVFHCEAASRCSWKQSNPAARGSLRGNKSYRVRENGGAQIAPPRPILLSLIPDFSLLILMN